MAAESPAAALEAEHRAIDRWIADGSHDALRTAIRLLRRHIYVEEEWLFPSLPVDVLRAPLLVMLREHGQIWQTLDALERVSGPARTLCHRLQIQLLHHNSKEERILYPLADDALSSERAARLIDFLDGGTVPPGWTCFNASVRASPQQRMPS